MTAPLYTNVTASSTPDLDRLRGPTRDTLDKEKARLRQATKEFESFFVYEMLKTMRETIPEGGLDAKGGMSDGLGKETYTSMFDMEIARRVQVGGHNSIADLLYNSMEPLVEAEFEQRQTDPEIKPLDQPQVGPLPLSGQRDIPLGTGNNDAEPVALPRHEHDIAPLHRQQQAAPGRDGAAQTVSPADNRNDEAVRSLPVQQSHPTVKQDDVLARYGTHIHAAARENKLDSSLIAAVIRTESSGNPRAVSHRGAKGLMQISDTTAQDLQVSDPFDPGENIRAGSRYLRRLLDRFGDLKLALAAYNAGPGNVDKYGGVPPFEETRQYLSRISDQLKQPL